MDDDTRDPLEILTEQFPDLLDRARAYLASMVELDSTSRWHTDLRRPVTSPDDPRSWGTDPTPNETRVT